MNQTIGNRSVPHAYKESDNYQERKEKSPYKPSDIWTKEEHAIFLKYCHEKRDKCYHSMANDTSARPLNFQDVMITVLCL